MGQWMHPSFFALSSSCGASTAGGASATLRCTAGSAARRAQRAMAALLSAMDSGKRYWAGSRDRQKNGRNMRKTWGNLGKIWTNIGKIREHMENHMGETWEHLAKTEVSESSSDKT